MLTFSVLSDSELILVIVYLRFDCADRYPGYQERYFSIKFVTKRHTAVVQVRGKIDLQCHIPVAHVMS